MTDSYNFDKKKPINFPIGTYIENGFELFRNNFFDLTISTLFVILLSFIPFCSFIAIGNFYKICDKIEKKEKYSVFEIFNFDDFFVFFKIQLYIIAIVILVAGIGLPFAITSNQTNWYVLAYYLLAAFTLFYLFLRSFYMIYDISVGKEHNIKKAWQLSFQKSKTNFFKILGFNILTSIILNAGFFLFFLGGLLTTTIYFCSQYKANKDAKNKTITT